MPNKDYMEKKDMQKFLPSNWKGLDERRQQEIDWKFGYMLEKDSERRILMKNFNPDNWMKLDENQKIQVCQKLENNLSTESGRHPYKIIQMSQTGIGGITTHKDRTIGINFNHSPYTVLDSLVHESCHADQFDLILQGKFAHIDENLQNRYRKDLGRSGLNEKDILVMKWESFHYSEGLQDDKIYRMQLSEVEAVLETTKFMNKYSEYIEKNPLFDQFLEKKNREINILNDAFNDEKLVKEWLDDRRERVEKTDMTMFTKQENIQLRAIYSSQNLRDCGFNLLADLELWSKRGAAKVKAVTLDELTGEKAGTSKSETKARSEMQPAKPKKAAMSLACFR